MTPDQLRAIEPAPQTADESTSGEHFASGSAKSAGADPLPADVAEMVERLRNDHDRNYEDEAADMLERQQHRIAELEAQRERADIIKWRRIHTPDEQEIFYLSRLPSIRTVARTLGYAIGVHGSMRRDLDLIAVPWVEKHSTPDALAKAIQYAACGMHGDVVTWQQKPCGRIATSLPICWTEDNRPSSGHIDLSVMVSNSELSSSRPLAAEGSRSNDGLEHTENREEA